MFKKLIIIIFLALLFYTIYLIHYANNTQVKMDKHYNKIFIENSEVVDYKIFRTPTDKYSVLKQIDSNVRLKISNYMEINNLKLAEGEHQFNRLNGTYEELILHDFKFTEID